MKTKLNKKGESVLRNPWFYFAVVAVIVLLAVLVRPGFTRNVVVNSESQAVQQQAQNVPSAAPSVVEVSEDDDAFKGSEDAPVIIIEFSDYECPFCARFYSNTLAQLEKEYIDTGKVRFVYRDFPLGNHRYAQKAAESTEVAYELGGNEAFWEMHNKIFENQQAISVSDLKNYAREIGLDGEQFDSLLDSGKYESEVQQDLQEGVSAGVQGTPTFFINGQKLVGARPFSEFQRVIEQELNG